MYDGQWGYIHHRLCFDICKYFKYLCMSIFVTYVYSICMFSYTVYTCHQVPFLLPPPLSSNLLPCFDLPHASSPGGSSSSISKFSTGSSSPSSPLGSSGSTPSSSSGVKSTWISPQKSALGRSIKCLVPQQAMVLEQPWSMVDTYNTLVNWGVYQSNPPLHGKKSKCGWSGQIQGWRLGFSSVSHCRQWLSQSLETLPQNRDEKWS